MQQYSANRPHIFAPSFNTNIMYRTALRCYTALLLSAWRNRAPHFTPHLTSQGYSASLPLTELLHAQGTKGKRLRLKEIRESKGAEPSASPHNGLVKQEYTPIPAGCSPALSPTLGAPDAPAAEGTFTLQQILTGGVTYTDSGRACKPPQAFVPGVTPKRPNSAKKVFTYPQIIAAIRWFSTNYSFLGGNGWVSCL